MRGRVEFIAPGRAAAGKARERWEGKEAERGGGEAASQEGGGTGRHVSGALSEGSQYNTTSQQPFQTKLYRKWAGQGFLATVYMRAS